MKNKVYLLHKYSLSRLGEVAFFKSNIWKPAKRARKNEETEKYILNKRTRYNLRKRL